MRDGCFFRRRSWFILCLLVQVLTKLLALAQSVREATAEGG